MWRFVSNPFILENDESGYPQMMYHSHINLRLQQNNRQCFHDS